MIRPVIYRMACLLMVVASLVSAQDADVRNRETLERMQGSWEILEVYSDTKKLDSPKIPRRVRVNGKKVKPVELLSQNKWFAANGLDIGLVNEDGSTIYSVFKSRGMAAGINDDLPNQIVVFWFVGLYRFKDERLELVLKYAGQGVEGEQARRWKPPVDFERRAGQEHFHLLLGRPANHK